MKNYQCISCLGQVKHGKGSPAKLYPKTLTELKQTLFRDATRKSEASCVPEVIQEDALSLKL